MYTKSNILSTLAYFDLFNYPLTQREIWLFLQNTCNTKEFNAALSDLTQKAIVNKFGELYSLQNEPSITSHRIEGNKKAAALIKTAKKVSRLLAKFPFVRAVGISGSLSKNFADDESDIDLFIITAENKLWVTRTFMHFFKKITFLFNRQHFFCMNYYIDEKELEIEEKNIYTATELVTVIPMQGETAFKNFYTANSWSKSFLPNHFLRVSSSENIKFFLPKYIIEKTLNNRFGNWLDDCLMKITAARWAKKTSANKKNNRGVTMSMIAKKHLAKPDPVFFQSNLLNRYSEKVSQIVKQYESDYAEVK
ncbi:MAG TPA: nucleotidyltransferase domain-containing protein [Puia sp.]|jgi:predicted nucleotidyltransferase|nr:nucleotidyltransferase domain-containing protein [Puia sp.]